MLMKYTIKRVLILVFVVSVQQKLEAQVTEIIGQKEVPSAVIFDTDIAEDYDDVGAIAVLYALEDLDEIEVLATVSSNANSTTVPTLSVLNTYFGREQVPIGVTKKEFPNRPCKQGWAMALVKDYPHNIKSNEDAEDSVSLYRRILSERKDQSVTILTVGFFTNLASLLASGPDKYSPLSGTELVKKKVCLLVSMAARLDADATSGREYNIRKDIPSAKLVFEQWDTPIVLSPFEIGVKVLTGIPLINNEKIMNSPVKEAYRIALNEDTNTKGRMSWDQIAVLVAARGIAPYFNSRQLDMKITDDGINFIVPGNRITYLTFRQTPEQIAEVIEKLMAYQPR